MQWKQWCTDEASSKPVQLLSASEAASLKQWRPAEEKMEFPSQGAPILDWLGRLEAWRAGQPAGSDYLGLHREFTWLRAAVCHSLPGTYAPGGTVDDILRDLRALPRARPEARAPGAQHPELPLDLVAQMYPGADLPTLPHDALVRVEGVTHTHDGAAIRSNVLVPGSRIVVAAPGGTTAHGQELPIVVGQVVDTSCKRGTLLMAWYLPQLARVENSRGGKNKLSMCSGHGHRWTRWPQRIWRSAASQSPFCMRRLSWKRTSTSQKTRHCHMMCSTPFGRNIRLI